MKVTGQLMIRKTNAVIDGREVVMVFGVIAAGKGEIIDLKGEHQYSVVGMDVLGDIHLQIIQASKIDRTKENGGMLPGQILTQPIWRI